MAASRLYAFAATLARAPAVVSFALDDAGADLIERVHDAGVTLGAAGVNLGSRFLASAESPVGERWKKALVTHPSQDWIQAGFINAMNPNPGTLGFRTRLRLLRTEFVERWEARTHEVEIDPAPVLAELNEAVAAGDKEALLVVGGQSAGLIRHVEPAGAIVRALVAETREALAEGAQFEL